MQKICNLTLGALPGLANSLCVLRVLGGSGFDWKAIYKQKNGELALRTMPGMANSFFVVFFFVFGISVFE